MLNTRSTMATSFMGSAGELVWPVSDQSYMINLAGAMRGDAMRYWSAASAALVTTMLGCTSIPETNPSTPTTPEPEPLALMERVADWELAHVYDPASYPTQ